MSKHVLLDCTIAYRAALIWVRAPRDLDDLARHPYAEDHSSPQFLPPVPRAIPCCNLSVGLFLPVPTIVREDGFVVRVYGPPREHPPPHVHVECGAESVVVIRLGHDGAPPFVWAAYGMKRKDIVRAFRLVEKYHDRIEAAWREIHGKA